MAKQIARLLKATIQDTSDLKQIAKRLAEKGRGGDTMLAHITPKEANILKAAGGAGTVNPDTGLLEFYNGDYQIPSNYAYGADYAAASASPTTDFGYLSTPIQTIDVRQPEAPAPTYTPSQYDLGYGQAPSVGFQMPTTPEVGFTPPSTFGAVPSAAAYQPVPEVSKALAAPQATTLGQLKAGLTSPETLTKLGLAGISAIPGILQARQASKQGQEAKAELQKLAQPYQQQGRQLLEQAQRGELTAPNQQQMQAMQARIAQGVASRGGVGSEQAAAQVEAFRQQLLNNQYNLGLQVSGIGDQIAQGAIKAGLQADQYVNALTQNYFTNIARTMGGYAPQTQQPQQGGQ